MVTYRWCGTTFLSLIGAVAGFSDFSFSLSEPAFSAFAAAFSVYEGWRTGVWTEVRGGATEVEDVSCFAGETAPDEAAIEFILTSDLMASFVENIRVSRFVIEGFSIAPTTRSFDCGSAGGAATAEAEPEAEPEPAELLPPFRLSASTVGMGVPFCDVTGRDSGELMAEEVCEVEGVDLEPSNEFRVEGMMMYIFFFSSRSLARIYLV